ncbi:MAG: dual specificity protein phosphatase 23 [Nitrososphaeraceae archaeon]
MTRLGDTYRWIYGNIYNKPTNFSWIIDNKLAGCAIPTNKKEIEWLYEKQKIKTIVTIREEPLPSEWIENDIEYKYVKSNDLEIPLMEDIIKTIDFIDIQIKKNKPVIVHCLAGKGRTGTILACYLVKHDEINAIEAIKKVRKLRPGSIQSEMQENAIYKFEKIINKNKK